VGTLSESRSLRSGFRLLACDLDGTLLDERGQLTPPVCAFLDRVQSRGVEVVAATGRRLSSALPLLREARIRGDCVVLNGAVVASIETGRIWRSVCLGDDACRSILEVLKSEGFAPLVYSSGEPGLPECTIEQGSVDPTGYIAFYRRYAGDRLRVVEQVLSESFAETSRIVTHESSQRLCTLGARIEPLAARLGLRCFQSYDTALKIHRFEVLHSAATKWEGVKAIAAARAIGLEQVLAVGDDANDVEMLAGAGHSLAAPQATEAARVAAREKLSGEGPPHLLVIQALERNLLNTNGTLEHPS